MLFKKNTGLGKTKFNLFIFLFFSEYSFSYWQQKADYDIDIVFDHKNHQFTGKQSITYFNHSNDTLHKIFIHLYFNAFQPGSMMDIRSRSLPDPDRRVMDRISKLSKSEIGFHQIQKIQQDGKDLKHHIQGTVLEVDLIDPLLPNNSSIFYLEYFSQVPIQIRRCGRDSKEGIDYSMAQWFPKIAGYDKQGWHAHPYIAREFYSPWGNYDVSIKIDKKYIVGATGDLNSKLTDDNDIIWNFKAEKVHDFVWAADPDYTHDILSVPEINLDLHFYYQANSDEMVKNWKKLQKHTADAFLYFNKKFGEYPYGKYSVIQGGDGGMEYSMLTLINYGDEFVPLVSVTSHELAHAWFQGVLATNEMNHEWMDEGAASYFGDLAESFVLKTDFYRSIMSSYGRYIGLANSGMEMPQSTNANRYKFNRAYESTAYSKGFVFLSQLRYIIGNESFKKTIKNYFNTYKFTHPLPNDFRRIAEQSSGILLNWYLTDWTQTTNKIDYAIHKVEKSNKKSIITLKRIGLMPMPLEVLVKLKDDTEEFYYIPITLMRGEKKKPDYAERWTQVEDWSWAYKNYILEIDHELESIQSININPTGLIADSNSLNDIITFD